MVVVTTRGPCHSAAFGRTSPVVFDEPGTPNTVALMLGRAATIFFVRIPRPAVILLARLRGSSGAASLRSTFAPPH